MSPAKGQVTIPKRVREALGITPGSKIEFDLDRGGASLKVLRRRVPSRIEEGLAVLKYRGPRIPIAKVHGEVAMKKAVKRARAVDTNVLRLRHDWAQARLADRF